MHCRDIYVLCILFTAKAGCGEELKNILSQVIRGCEGQEGLLFCSMHQNKEDPDIFMFYEHFTSEASFRLHMDSALIRKTYDAFSGLVDGEPKVTYWSLLEKTDVKMCR